MNRGPKDSRETPGQEGERENSNSNAGFELGFDHWGTTCPLCLNFGGHFCF